MRWLRGPCELGRGHLFNNYKGQPQHDHGSDEGIAGFDNDANPKLMGGGAFFFINALLQSA